MDTPIRADLLLTVVAYAAFIGVGIVACVLTLAVRALRRLGKMYDQLKQKQADGETAIMVRLAGIEAQQTRQATNLAALTMKTDNSNAVLSEQIKQIASREQTEQIVQAQMQQMALMLMGLRPPPQTFNMAGGGRAGNDTREGGTELHGPTTAYAPIVGGNVGRMEPPRPNERERPFDL